MHKQIIQEEQKELKQELKDIDSLKKVSKEDYDKAENYLDEQDETIHRVANRIRLLSER